MKSLLFCICTALVVNPPAFAQVPPIEKAEPAETTVVTLTTIKKIYVAPLGTVAGSEIIRQKVINGLIKSGIVRVVESADVADATLTGASEIDRRHSSFVNISPYGSSVSSSTRYSAECVARLVSKDKQVLWTADITSRKWFGPRSSRAASSNVADKIIKEIIEAIAPPEKQLASK